MLELPFPDVEEVGLILRSFPGAPRSGLVHVLAGLSGRVRLEQVLRERHAKRWLHVRGKWVLANRASFQLAIINQMSLARRFLGVFLAKLFRRPCPNFCGMIDSGLSLFVRVLGESI